MDFARSPKRPVRLALAGPIAALLVAGAHAAEDPALALDLPAQPLSATLDSLARQAKVKLLYSDAAVRGLQAAALKGRYTLQQALDKTLSDSGLHSETVDRAIVAIKPRPPAPSKPDAKREDNSSFTLGTIEVLGKRTTGVLRTKDILTSVDIVNSPELLEKQNAEYSWGLFQNLPGVEITRFNQGTTSGKLSFRAFNGEGEVNAVKLLIDGIPSNSNDGNMPFIDAVFPLEIDTIEVVRGTNDPRYGLHSIAGNANIVTRQGGNYLKSRLTYGSFDTFEMQHFLGHEKDGFSQNYFAGYRSSSGYREHSDIDKFAFSGKWFYTPDNGRVRAGLIARWYDADAEEPGYLTLLQSREKPTFSNPFSKTDGSKRSVGQLSAHVDVDLLDNLSWSLKSYGNLFNERRWVKFSENVSQQERIADEVQYGALSSVTYRPEVPFLDDFSVEAGVDFQYQENTSQRYLTRERSRTSQTRDQRFDFYTYGGYIQSIIRPTSWLKIVPAYRADGIGGDFLNRLNERTAKIYDYGTVSQPKISAVLTPIEGYNLYANWGRTFQVGLASGAYKLNPLFGNLKPSINDGWETGIKFKPVDWVEGRVAYWEQTASEEVRRKLNDPLGDSENVGSTKRRGFDAQISVRPTRALNLWGAYALQEAKIVKSNATATVGKTLDHIPDFLFSGGIDYDITEDLKASIWANVGGDYFLENANKTGKFGDFALLNLRLGYQIRKYANLEFQVKNLTDQYYEYAWYDGAQTLHSPGDGIAFYGAANLQFDY